MSGFDADRVYSVSVHQNANTSSFSTESPSDTEKLLLDFLLQYRIGGEFIYRYSTHYPCPDVPSPDLLRPEINSEQIYF
jgi:hypothetical protein